MFTEELKIKKYLKEIFRIQNEQNAKIWNSEHWYKEVDRTLLKYPIYEEIGEFINSTKYHWWKKFDKNVTDNKEKLKLIRARILNEVNNLYSNFYMEIVDLIHFIVTLDIVDLYHHEKDFTENKNLDTKTLLQKIDEYIDTSKLIEYLINYNNNLQKIDNADIISEIDNFVFSICSSIYEAMMSDYEPFHVHNVLIFLSELKKFTGVNLIDYMRHIYNVYIGKYTLNMFRQDNGYKENKYIKIWTGKKEDNYYLMEYLKQNSGRELSYDEIYDYLKSEYAKIRKTS